MEQHKTVETVETDEKRARILESVARKKKWGGIAEH